MIIHHKYSAFLLSLILTLAGISHFIIPNEFLKAMPPYLPFPLLLIYVSGLFEIVLAAFLVKENYRSQAGLVASAYFVILIPIHVYVSLNGIEMFGVADKALLWLRTVFQAVFIYWAYSFRTSSTHFCADQS